MRVLAPPTISVLKSIVYGNANGMIVIPVSSTASLQGTMALRGVFLLFAIFRVACGQSEMLMPGTLELDNCN